jgi:pimeloyl-ACP methyl ester carboxylesterase
MRFVLIHGGFHGAWCWSRVIPELQKLGHDAIAIDLPGHGQRRDERSTLADRRDAIVAVMQPGDVLVGHSGGGYDITLAADARPGLVDHLIYLAAGLPLEGRSVLEATGGAAREEADGKPQVTNPMSNATGMGGFIEVNAQGRIQCVDKAKVAEFFYHDCDQATIDWAFPLLTPAPTEFLTEIVSVPNFWRAEFLRSYIHCLQERSKPYAMSRAVIARLGVTPIPIDTSHSPFLSRPAELARLFVYATLTTPIRSIRPI